jgi:hypothetical protein
VITYGSNASPQSESLSKVLNTWSGEGIELLAPPLCPAARAAGGAEKHLERVDGVDTEKCNRLAEDAASEYILFLRLTVSPFPECISAMASLLDATEADAAVCAYRIFGADGIPVDVPVFGGAPELTTQRNHYGAGIFMVRKDRFLALGGFADDPAAASIPDWDFLNRLRASGGRIMAVPTPMAVVEQEPVFDLSDQARGRLAQPWVKTAPASMQGFVRMALHGPNVPAASASRAGALKSRKAEPKAERRSASPRPWTSDSPLNAILEDSSQFQPSPDRRLVAAGLLEDVNTFIIRSAADASECDFLVSDNLISELQSEQLGRALSGLWDRPMVRHSQGQINVSTLSLHEVVADRPREGHFLHDMLQRAVALTTEFYRLTAPLEPHGVHILRRGSGPLNAREAAAENAGSDAIGFRGLIYLNSQYEGGFEHFPKLDMIVQPSLGMVIAATDLSYHRSVAQSVASGSQMILECKMRFADRPQG